MSSLRDGTGTGRRPESRRLALDVLVTAVRRSGDVANVYAFNALSFVCEEEYSRLCGDETRLVHLANRTAHGYSNTPIVVEALRDVHLCLASNSESLRPDCLVHLVNSFLQSYTPSNGRSNTTSSSWSWGNDTDSSIQNKTQEAIRKVRHANGDFDHRDDDYHGRETASGTHIYVINNTGTVVLSPAIIPLVDNWNRHDSWNDVHGLVWIAVLSFFCVGVAVVTKSIIAFIKQRQSDSRYSVANGEYLPLQAHDSSAA